MSVSLRRYSDFVNSKKLANTSTVLPAAVEVVGMTSLARITAASWSEPVSAMNTPREIEGVRHAKVIGKHLKPVIGGRVLLAQKVAAAVNVCKQVAGSFCVWAGMGDQLQSRSKHIETQAARLGSWI